MRQTQQVNVGLQVHRCKTKVNSLESLADLHHSIDNRTCPSLFTIIFYVSLEGIFALIWNSFDIISFPDLFVEV